MRRIAPAVLAVLAVLLFASGTSSARPRVRVDRRTYALGLVAEGRKNLAYPDVDHRRKALSLFEEAAVAAPKEPEVLVALGDAYVDARYLHRARTTFERALAVAPESPEAHFGFARIRRREWLDSGWNSDLADAITEIHEATRLRPEYAPALQALTALDVENDDVDGAHEAAEAALRVEPQGARSQLVAAEMAYRTGNIARADSLFRAGIAGLEPAVAAHFSDISPLVPQRDSDARLRLAPAEQAEIVRRFWAAHDPDPVTPQNEAQLEFWSRQAHALLLLGDPWGPIWRERTSVYVRYGRRVQIDDPMGGPHHEMPRLDLGEIAEAPTPEQLERLEQVTAGGGQSAFAPLPPGAEPLPIAARVVRFGSGAGSRLLAQVEAPGSPGEKLDAEFVVLDASEDVVARSSRPLSASACDPSAERAGDFAIDVTPGAYTIAVAVHDDGHRRGVKRVPCDALPSSGTLEMSEIAPNCGPPELATEREGVRLNPNPRARVVGTDPLVAYFEIDHLETEGRNTSRFEYAYQVRELGAPGVPWYRQRMDGSAAASGLAFTTTQEGVGPLRRQFIRVPTHVLPAGRYEIVVSVHDLVSGRDVSEAMTFSRLWSQSELYGEDSVPAGR